MDELFKPCERLKLPAVIRNTATDRNRQIVYDDLHLLVLKRGNLFDENCDGAQYFGNCCD